MFKTCTINHTSNRYHCIPISGCNCWYKR